MAVVSRNTEEDVDSKDEQLDSCEDDSVPDHEISIAESNSSIGIRSPY